MLFFQWGEIITNPCIFTLIITEVDRHPDANGTYESNYARRRCIGRREPDRYAWLRSWTEPEERFDTPRFIASFHWDGKGLTFAILIHCTKKRYSVMIKPFATIQEGNVPTSTTTALDFGVSSSLMIRSDLGSSNLNGATA